MTDLVFKSDKGVEKEIFLDFIKVTFPSFNGNASLLENEYGKYLSLEGKLLTACDLADCLIRYAWLHDFDKAVVVNRILFGDNSFLHYAILKTLAEVLCRERVQHSDKSTYLILDRKTGYIKIGATSNISKRLKTLSCGNLNLVVIALAFKNIEKELHDKYANKKIDGEFYALNKDEISSIIKEYGFEDCLICNE